MIFFATNVTADTIDNWTIFSCALQKHNEGALKSQEEKPLILNRVNDYSPNKLEEVSLVVHIIHINETQINSPKNE